MEAEAAPAAPAPEVVVVFLADGGAVALGLEHAAVAAAELLRRLRGGLRLGEGAANAVALWLVSPLLEVQLKPRHQPLRLSRQWPELLLRFTDAPPSAIAADEPCLHLRRNVFFPKKKELELEDEELLRLLYEEARGNVLGGRYPVDPEDAEELGGIACRLRLGPFDQSLHTPDTLRPLLGDFFPPPPPRGGGFWGLLRPRRNRPPSAPPPEVALVRAFREAPGPQVPPPGLYRAFLRRCHQLPYYGCAFFPGAIDRPPGGLLGRGGLRGVSVAVGLEGVTIVDPRQKHVLLSLAFPELCWELVGAGGGAGGGAPGDGAEGGGPAGGGGTDSGPPQLWLEFDGEQGGAPVNRLLRVLSPQAELMSSLIECCIALGGADPPPGTPPPPNTPPPKTAPPLRRQDSVTRPRLQRLATIDYVEDGQELRRVKPPRRSASFFSRGGGSGGGSGGGGAYAPVPGGAALEQG